ncbi:restriction system modified-DNA reader domain-containing protein [Streptomyces capillispiralis]|uniref:Uncharacterized protein DUF4357 n=1 Tax=Streptomyces capillispiralis TaxID=68182 RepID=A0A561TLE6_9ACTN|nr:DUF4357 domain-containing protein [Streptomyces capillispiralis]TWF87892.1 uncharacterized protein DUF4357 [Streptomyces capillispiralis]GHH95017.1 hypothetical protein GCM10017779_54740 [Streptomyces capillispiralis]
MPKHTIVVDHEVYERLQREAKPFVDNPNTVLRRLLDLGQEAPGAARRRRSSVAPLLTAGLLMPGQRLTWRRRNLGETHTAYVTEDGYLRLEDGTICDSPSGACETVADCKINGWSVWYTDDGVSLSALRDRR